MDAQHPRDVCAELSILTVEIQNLRSLIAELTAHLIKTPTISPPRESLKARRERLEGRAILLLEEFGGNRKRVAQELNVPLSTIRYWDKFDAAYRYCIALDQADRVSRSSGVDSDDLDLD